jgi:hypothetical protein
LDLVIAMPLAYRSHRDIPNRTELLEILRWVPRHLDAEASELMAETLTKGWPHPSIAVSSRLNHTLAVAALYFADQDLIDEYQRIRDRLSAWHLPLFGSDDGWRRLRWTFGAERELVDAAINGDGPRLESTLREYGSWTSFAGSDAYLEVCYPAYLDLFILARRRGAVLSSTNLPFIPAGFEEDAYWGESRGNGS